MSSASRHDLRERMEVPERRALPGQRHVEALGARRACSARSSAACRSSTAASRRSRTAFSAMPVSRSRTSRSASFSSLFRPRNRTRRSSSVVERSTPPRSRSEPRSRAPGRPSADCTIGLRDLPLRPFRGRLRHLAADMTEDVPFYVELAREAGRADRRAGGGHRPCCDSRRARDRPSRDRHRPRRRRCSPRRRCVPSRRAPTSTSARATCATSRSTSRRRSSTARFARCSTCPPGTTSGASSSASPRASSRAAGSPGTCSASTTRSRRGSTGRRRTSRCRSRLRYSPADNRVDIECDRGRAEHDLALVGDEVRVGRPDRRRRPRGGGALRLVRPAAVRRREQGVRVGDAQAGLASAYDSIARLYDPWSRSVVEDVAFYVEEAIARGARARRRARRRHGPHRRSRRRGGHLRHRRRLAPPACSTSAARRPSWRASRRCSTCGSATTRRRPWPSASRSCSARSGRICTCTRGAERSQALRAAHDLLVPGGRFVFDVFTPSAEDIEETHGRWLEREPGIFERADWDTTGVF